MAVQCGYVPGKGNVASPLSRIPAVFHTVGAVCSADGRRIHAEGGDLLIGVADNGAIVGLEPDRLENDDKFMRHLAQVVRNGLGDRASTCIDPKTQIVQGKTVCVVSCQRSPEPVFLKWKGLEAKPEGDFYVRSGPGTIKLSPESTAEFVKTRFAEKSHKSG
jgi:predicted HTH transcriptional regulator